MGFHIRIISVFGNAEMKLSVMCNFYSVFGRISIMKSCKPKLLYNRRNGVVVRASALQSVDLGFIPLVESYQKTFKNGIHSFPHWRSTFRGSCDEQAGKFACCVLGQGT